MQPFHGQALFSCLGIALSSFAFRSVQPFHGASFVFLPGHWPLLCLLLPYTSLCLLLPLGQCSHSMGKLCFLAWALAIALSSFALHLPLSSFAFMSVQSFHGQALFSCLGFVLSSFFSILLDLAGILIVSHKSFDHGHCWVGQPNIHEWLHRSYECFHALNAKLKSVRVILSQDHKFGVFGLLLCVCVCVCACL